MRLIDLSSPVDAAGWEPDPVEHRVQSPAEGARHVAAEMKEHFGLDFDPAVFPDGEFLNNDFLCLSVHTGTHVDAPAHYGSRTAYGLPPTIDQLPLEPFFRPGLLLDLTGRAPGAMGPDVLRAAFERAGREPAPDDIVLLDTGAARHAGSARFFTDFVGLDGPAVHLLLDLGVRVIGTDAFSLDAPFTDILARYAAGAGPQVLWPAHLAGREREYYQIERLANLAALPGPDGFLVCCFPVKVRGAGAGWARAVAVVED